MPNWGNNSNSIVPAIDFAGTVGVEWHRRGRWIVVTVPYPGDQKLRLQIGLEDLARECQISREEIIAIADSVGGQVVLHPDVKALPLHEAMRLEAIPQDLTGKTALDIGGWDGEFAAECLKRGALSAVCFDSEQWRDYSWVRPVTHPGVTYKRGDLMDFSHNPAVPADVVLLYNVIYHIRDPWLALERCRLLTRETFVICTSFVEGDDPTWKLFGPEDEDAPGGVINDRYTVFWRPTINGLLKMLRLVGFKDPEVFGPVGDHVCIRCH